MDPVTVDAAKVVGYSAAAGAGLSVAGAALNNNSQLGYAALGGAVGGAALASLGGLIVAIFSSKHRDEALQVAGIGLGATIVGRLL